LVGDAGAAQGHALLAVAAAADVTDPLALSATLSKAKGRVSKGGGPAVVPPSSFDTRPAAATQDKRRF
ncbi:MAG: hypothetical protein ACREUN_15845, partial [Burkholderiales bacterium]